MNTKKFFSTLEVARMCQVSQGTIIRWIHENKLRAAVTAGGHHRIHFEEAGALLERLGMPVPPELSGIGIKAVIIDDEPVVREFLRDVFHRYFPDFHLEEAADGFSAGTLVSSVKPHLVILDIMLPGLDGFQVCEYIRKHPELDKTKIIVVSGLAAGEVEDKIIKMGADDFLEKPVDVELFREKIIKHLKIQENGGKNHGLAA